MSEPILVFVASDLSGVSSTSIDLLFLCSNTSSEMRSSLAICFLIKSFLYSHVLYFNWLTKKILYIFLKNQNQHRQLLKEWNNDKR